MGYNLTRLERWRDRLKQELPDGWHVEDWQDYGWKLTVCNPERTDAWIIFQPARHENGQTRVSPTDEQIEQWLASILEPISGPVDNLK